MQWPLGVVSVVYGNRHVREAARIARGHGFQHIDVTLGDPTDLVIPVGDRFSMFPRPGFTSGPAPIGARTWEKTVDDYRNAPGARMEPWLGSIVGTTEEVFAMLEEVPGLRLTLDVGHVVAWGGDPAELLPYADHVQLRQAKRGHSQAIEGEVDFSAILKCLEELDYRGKLSVEYFDLPQRGWSLDDPIAAAFDVAEQLRALM